MEQVFNYIADPSYGTPDTPSSLDPPFLRKKIPTSSGQDTAPSEVSLTPLESKIKNLILSAYTEEPALPKPSNKNNTAVATSSAPVTPLSERRQWSPSFPPSLPLHLIPAKTSDSDQLGQLSKVKTDSNNSLYRSVDSIMSSSSDHLTGQ